jgi:hypothetical protein
MSTVMRIPTMIINVDFITRISKCVNNNKYEKNMKNIDGTMSNISPIILFCFIILVAPDLSHS